MPKAHGTAAAAQKSIAEFFPAVASKRQPHTSSSTSATVANATVVSSPASATPTPAMATPVMPVRHVSSVWTPSPTVPYAGTQSQRSLAGSGWQDVRQRHTPAIGAAVTKTPPATTAVNTYTEDPAAIAEQVQQLAAAMDERLEARIQESLRRQAVGDSGKENIVMAAAHSIEELFDVFDDDLPIGADNFRPPLKRQKCTIVRESNGANLSNRNSTTTSGSSSSSAALAPIPMTLNSSGKKPKPVKLSAEQNGVLDMIVNKNRSVFFTGPAGTGKSLLLREIIAKLKKRFGRSRPGLTITASTGIAAINIGGTTLHSFAGLGIHMDTRDRMLTKLKKNRYAMKRWTETQVLIIDEISMVDGQFFDTLEWIARQVRYSDQPFGGIQVVLCGDFFQLPPVPDKGSAPINSVDAQASKRFCFDADSWKRVVRDTIQLTTVFRQRDEEFVRVLNECRMNTLSAASIECLTNLSRPLTFDDGVEPTELYPLRHQVDNANKQRLDDLKHVPPYAFVSDDWFARPDDNFLRKRLETTCIAPATLQLKVGAQVMMTANLDQTNGIVNGSLGIIDRFDVDNMPIVRFVPLHSGTYTQLVKVELHEWTIEEQGKIIAVRRQIPLILAWAMSIHKSQGQTIPRMKVDLGKAFECGQAYVALSRAVSLDGLQVLNFNPTRVMAHPRVIAFHATVDQEQNTSTETKTTLKVDADDDYDDDDAFE